MRSRPSRIMFIICFKNKYRGGGDGFLLQRMEKICQGEEAHPLVLQMIEIAWGAGPPILDPGEAVTPMIEALGPPPALFTEQKSRATQIAGHRFDTGLVQPRRGAARTIRCLGRLLGSDAEAG